MFTVLTLSKLMFYTLILVVETVYSHIQKLRACDTVCVCVCVCVGRGESSKRESCVYFKQ